MTRRTQTIPVPDIAFGSYKITDELTGGRSCEVIREALDTGYRYIDTAAFYQNEDVIGQAIEDSGISRGELLLQTKVWKTELSYEKTRRSIEASLGKLRTDYLDYLLIHWPKESPDDPDWKIKLRESWRAMERLVDEGLVKKYIIDGTSPACFEYVGEALDSECEACFHFKCEKCGCLIHLHCDELSGLKGHLEEHHHVTLNPMRTVLYGLCEKCSGGSTSEESRQEED